MSRIHVVFMFVLTVVVFSSSVAHGDEVEDLKATLGFLHEPDKYSPNSPSFFLTARDHPLQATRPRLPRVCF